MSGSTKLVKSKTLNDLPNPSLREKALKILKVLDSYYPNPPIPLNHVNDFTFLCAVVLSAQTTDGKVNEVTKTLFSRASTPEKMIELTPQQIQAIIQPVGLAPRKAQYLYSLSKALLDKHDGKVPNTYEDLEALPGVGHKTASVIMSQCFGESSLAVDTHVHRLSLRWGLSKQEKNPDKVQADLYKVFPESSWNKAHLQMIYFGREYCTAKNHQVSYY
jgi:endonuclease-3